MKKRREEGILSRLRKKKEQITQIKKEKPIPIIYQKDRLPAKIEKAKQDFLKTDTDFPIKICSDHCKYRVDGRAGCNTFRMSKAQDGELCRVELKELKQWVKAYENGDSEIIRKRAGAIQGAIIQKIHQILDQITLDGMVFTAPKINRSGEVIQYKEIENGIEVSKVIMESKEHPLFKRLTELVRISGVNPHDFNLIEDKTSKAEVKGVIGNVEQLNMQVIISDSKKRMLEFKQAMSEANNFREEDPVYRRYKELPDHGKEIQEI